MTTKERIELDLLLYKASDIREAVKETREMPEVCEMWKKEWREIQPELKAHGLRAKDIDEFTRWRKGA